MNIMNIDKKLKNVEYELWKNLMPLVWGQLNDKQTRKLVFGEVVDILHKHSIAEYKIVCDETNNPPQVIDMNQLVVDVFVDKKNTTWDHIHMVYGPGDSMSL